MSWPHGVGAVAALAAEEEIKEAFVIGYILVANRAFQAAEVGRRQRANDSLVANHAKHRILGMQLLGVYDLVVTE